MKTDLRLIGGKRLQSPKNISTRPTTLRVREAIFNILNNRVENSNWLDLFSGTGAISCEAYNHGAKKIIAVEKNKSTSKICLKNLLSLQDVESRKNDIDVICKDVLNWTKPNTLLELEELNNWVYFVHSYHAIPDDFNIIAAQVNYGSEKLTAIIENDNLLACQFHPEKSGKTGEKLLRRWLSNIQ